jgi:hypothetical protein
VLDAAPSSREAAPPGPCPGPGRLRAVRAYCPPTPRPASPPSRRARRLRGRPAHPSGTSSGILGGSGGVTAWPVVHGDGSCQTKIKFERGHCRFSSPAPAARPARWVGRLVGCGHGGGVPLVPPCTRWRPKPDQTWLLSGFCGILDPCALSGCVPAKNGLAKYQLGLETASAWPAQGGVASKHGPRHFFRGLTHRQLSECEADDAAHGHVPASLK